MKEQRISSLLVGNGRFSRGAISNKLSKQTSRDAPASLKNVSNKQFLSSKKLINRYGLLSNSDGDRTFGIIGLPNFRDCFPFDKKRQDVISIQDRIQNDPEATARVNRALLDASAGVFEGAIWYNLKRSEKQYVQRLIDQGLFAPQETVTITDVPAEKLAPVVSKDYTSKPNIFGKNYYSVMNPAQTSQLQQGLQPQQTPNQPQYIPPKEVTSTNISPEVVENNRQRAIELLNKIKSTPENKAFNTQFDSYKSAGYSNKEAVALAEYSANTGSSLGPKEANKYLVRNFDYGYNYEDIKSSVKRKGLFPSAENYLVEVPIQSIGKLADYGLQKAGVPEDLTTFNVYFGAPRLPSASGNSVFNIETKRASYLPRSLSRQNFQPNQPSKTPINPNTIPPTFNIQSIDTTNQLRYKNLLFNQESYKVGETNAKGMIETGLGIGSFFIPGRAQLFTGSVLEKGYRGSVQTIREKGVSALPGTFFNYARENPIEVGGAALLFGGGIVKGAKYLNAPIKETESLYVSKNIEEPIVLQPKPFQRRVYTNIQGQNVIEDASKIKVISQDTVQGSKTVLTTRLRKALGLSPIYGGVPSVGAVSSAEKEAYGLLGKKSDYNKALDKLTKEGYTESQAREILRFSRPALLESTFKGDMVVKIINGETPIATILGTEKTVYKKGFVDGKDIPYRNGQGTARIITSSSGEGGPKGDLTQSKVNTINSYMTKEGNLYSKIRQAGKTNEAFDVISRNKQLLENDVYSVSRQYSISKRTNPNQKRFSFTTARVIQQKGEPDVTLFDTTIAKDNSIGKPSVKTGNAQILEQQTKQAMSSAISGLFKGKSISKAKADSIIKSSSDLPQIVTGMPSSGVSVFQPVRSLSRDIKGFEANYLAEESQVGPMSVSLRTVPPEKLRGVQVAGNILTGSSGLMFSQGIMSGLKSNQGFVSGLSSGQREIQKENQPVSNNFLFGLSYNERQGTSVTSPQAQSYNQDTSQINDNKPRQDIAITPIYPKPNPIRSREPTRDESSRSWLPGEREKLLNEKAYNAFVYIDSTKGKGYYVKLNEKPLTQKSALSLMARAVDNTISAKGKISPAPNIKQKGKIVSPKAIDNKDNYFSINRFKFREYSGKAKRPLPTGVVIERQKYRLDSGSEVSKIQTEKRNARRTPFGF